MLLVVTSLVFALHSSVHSFQSSIPCDCPGKWWSLFRPSPILYSEFPEHNHLRRSFHVERMARRRNDFPYPIEYPSYPLAFPPTTTTTPPPPPEHRKGSFEWSLEMNSGEGRQPDYSMETSIEGGKSVSYASKYNGYTDYTATNEIGSNEFPPEESGGVEAETPDAEPSEGEGDEEGEGEGAGDDVEKEDNEEKEADENQETAGNQPEGYRIEVLDKKEEKKPDPQVPKYYKIGPDGSKVEITPWWLTGGSPSPIPEAPLQVPLPLPMVPKRQRWKQTPQTASDIWRGMMASLDMDGLSLLRPPPLGQLQTWHGRRPGMRPHRPVYRPPPQPVIYVK